MRSNVGRKDKHGAVLAFAATVEAASVHRAGSIDMIGRRAGLVDHATSCIVASWKLCDAADALGGLTGATKHVSS